MEKGNTDFRKRLYQIVEIGSHGDTLSLLYDIFSILAIMVNLGATLLYTFDDFEAACGPLLLEIEAVTVFIFAVDYVLRIITAKYMWPKEKEAVAIWRYVRSFTGIIDLMSFLPYYLPIFFPTGAAAFRLFRIMRVFRLLRLNAYYDSLNAITEVLRSKSQQLIFSVFIIMVLMVASSLCMYSIEHDAQPHVFRNAFSGIWWSVSTLLTVGYGDIYPVTDLGKIFSIFITFLGVGMVAIPTGIISAGFVDQYSRIKRISEYGKEDDVNFIKVHISGNDRWVGKAIKDLGLPQGMIIAAVVRGETNIVPRGGVVIEAEDMVVLCAATYDKDKHIDLKEIRLRKHHPWVGIRIRDLDISRQTFIVMVKRDGRSVLPSGNMALQEGDDIILYTQSRIADAYDIQV